jgi:hypothetical protein
MQRMSGVDVLVCGALPACDSTRHAYQTSCIRRRSDMLAVKKKVEPIANIVIIVLERRSQGDERLFQQVSNADATATALHAKS